MRWLLHQEDVECRIQSFIDNVSDSSSQLDSSDESIIKVRPYRRSEPAAVPHSLFSRKEVIKPAMFEMNDCQSLWGSSNIMRATLTPNMKGMLETVPCILLNFCLLH